jgi:multidrug efflux pump subunit AcrA (membrane-fusion protein)
MRKSMIRMWPLVLAFAGISMLGYSAWRATSSDEGDVDLDLPVAPTVEAPVAHHFHEVAAHEVPVFQEFKGRVDAEGTIEIRAPQGMVVPVVKVHKEHGEFVNKGDILLTLAKEQVVKAIADAKAAGNSANVTRFEGYLEHVEIRAPIDGQVLEISTQVGEVPFDVGIPLMVLADRSSWSFTVMLPESVLQSSANLGTKLSIELEDDLGTVIGTVNSHGETTEGHLEALSGYVQVILGLEEHEGVEKNLVGVIRVPVSVQTASLVPKKAVEWRGDTPVVRVAEGDEFLERSLRIDGEIGEDFVVLYGVGVGEQVVVPDRAE